MAKRIRVLVIEDNRLVRDGLAALLDAQPDFKVVASAEGPDAGLLRVQETKPHVVLVDASLGNHSSHGFVESIRTTAPEARVIVMNLLPVEEDVVDFVKAGATGFVAKRARIDDLVATVRSVAGGAKVVLPPPDRCALFLNRETSDRSKCPSRDRRRTDVEAGAGGYRSNCRGPEQQGDRPATPYCHPHRQEPRAQHFGEARLAQSAPDCRSRTPGRRIENHIPVTPRAHPRLTHKI